MPDHEVTRVQIVGIDGSPGSIHALRWASKHDGVFGPAQPVSAWQYPWWALVPTAAVGQFRPPSRDQLQDIAERAAAHQVDEADVAGAKPPIAVHGAPGPALVTAAEGAGLLVVGTRGRGSVADNLLGSVSTHCVYHATGPVAVVPPDAGLDDQHRRVLVGVDGSDQSVAALVWALNNTAPDSSVDVVNSWHIDATIAEIAATAAARLAAQSEEILDDVVDRATSQVPDHGRDVQTRSLHGPPRQVLSDESRQADLLVVGSRGRGGLAHFLLGSVTTSLVHHPLTATIVVR